MTIEQITQSIVDAIHGEFGDDYPIRTEDTEQNLSPHCFTVRRINATRSRFLGRRWHRTFLFNVNYFAEDPSLDEDRTHEAEMNDVADRLFYCLDMITANGHYIHGLNKEATTSDGVLVMTISFDTYEIAPNDADIMQEMQETTIIARMR